MPAAPGVPTRTLAQAATRPMGTWKLAYADFLTALAAFFLVMWLVKGMPESGRAEIADYFADGTAPIALQDETAERPDPAGLVARALAASPALLAHADHIDVARTPEGLRIDLMDTSAAPLFASASTAPTAHGEALMTDVFTSLAALAWPLSLEGHTDAFAFQNGTASNWSLSANRADQARQIAETAGIAPARFAAITGYGDRRPRLPREPHHPTNRRVTVILHVPAHYSIPVSS